MAYTRYSLEGKKAVVTGASRGIGKAIALTLADAGADVAICGRNAEPLEEVAAEIKEKGREAMVIPCHVGKTDQVNELVKQIVDKWGFVDVLVNNAATNPIFGPILNSEEWALEKIIATNLKGPYLLGMAFGKLMLKEGRGSIVNVASTAGIEPAMGMGLYSVSKAGLIMLTKVLANEWGSAGVRANAVCPGVVKTKFSKALWSSDVILNEVTKGTPMGRIAESDEVADAVLFFASDQSRFITGQTITIDGGARM